MNQLEKITAKMLEPELAKYIFGMIKNSAHNSEPYGNFEEFASWGDEDWRKVALWENYLEEHFTTLADNMEYERQSETEEALDTIQPPDAGLVECEEKLKAAVELMSGYRRHHIAWGSDGGYSNKFKTFIKEAKHGQPKS